MLESYLFPIPATIGLQIIRSIRAYTTHSLVWISHWRLCSETIPDLPMA